MCPLYERGWREETNEITSIFINDFVLSTLNIILSQHTCKLCRLLYSMIYTNLKYIYYPASLLSSPPVKHNEYCISLVLKLSNNHNNLPWEVKIFENIPLFPLPFVQIKQYQNLPCEWKLWSNVILKLICFMAILGLGYFPLLTNLKGEVYTIYTYSDQW